MVLPGGNPILLESGCGGDPSSCRRRLPMAELSSVRADSGRRLQSWFRSRFDPGLLLVFLLPSFVAMVLLQPGIPRTADGYLHLLRVVEIDQAWRDGIFYPRWAPDMAFGYGYPIFNYFAPMLYHLTELVHLLGLGFEGAFKIVLIGSFVLGGWGMYGLVRDILGPRAGILAAAAYVYAPFMMREVFVRGGYAQILAMCIMPAALWSFRRLLVRDQPIYLLTTAVLSGAVVFGHNIGGMLFFPFLTFFGVWIIVSLRRWGKIKWMLAALVASLTLVSFFLVPSLAENSLVKLNRVMEDYFDFSGHFLTLGEILAPSVVPDSASFNPVWLLNLGTAQVALGVLGLVGIVVGPLTTEQKKQAAFFPVMVLVSVCMTLPISTPLWEHLPFLPFAQFPWRFLSIAMLGAAVLTGASVLLWSRLPWGKLKLALLGLLLTATVMCSFIHLYSQWPPVPREQLSPKDVVAHELRTGIVGTTSDSECLPVTVAEDPTGSPLVPQYLSSSPISKLDAASLAETASAELIRHTVVSDEYRISAPEPLTVRFNTFHFPGWQAYVDSQPVPIEVSYPEGLITFAVPAGEHRVMVRLGDTPIRTLASLVSWATALTLIAVTILQVLRRRTQGWVPDGVAGGICLSAADASVLGAFLVALLLVKEGFIDDQTTWFRMSSPPYQVPGVERSERINLEDEVYFLGYRSNSETVEAGAELSATVYWMAQDRLQEDYSVFLHLDDLRPNFISWALSEKLSPADIPTSSWAPGFYVSDPHLLTVSRDTPPGVYVLRAGLYLPDTGERLHVLDEQGTVLSDSIELGRVQVLRTEPVDLSAASEVGPFVFGEQIRLVGYGLDRDSARQGDYFRLLVYWEAETEVTADYRVFVHLLDGEGRVLAQSDGIPANGIYPTWAWIPSEIIEDEHLIPLDKDVAPGEYRLAIGLYEPDTLTRLRATDAEGVPLGDRILLPTAFEVLAH